MARLSRLTLPNHLHLVLQRGHGAAPVFVDEQDVDAYMNALHEAAREWQVTVHAFGFTPQGLRLLVTPPDATALSKLMQSVSRRHAAWLNRRHGRSGTPWQGRFASAPVEAGPGLFEVMRFVEIGEAEGGGTALRSSADHHRGVSTARGLVDPAGYWALGNTPFDRESAYRRLSDIPLFTADTNRIRAAVINGWPIGSEAFAHSVASAQQRPVGPSPRGRPRKSRTEDGQKPV